MRWAYDGVLSSSRYPLCGRPSTFGLSYFDAKHVERPCASRACRENPIDLIDIQGITQQHLHAISVRGIAA